MAQLKADSNAIFGPDAPHYDEEDLEQAIADAEEIAASHIPAPRPTTPDQICAPHRLPPPVVDISKLGCCMYIEGAPTTDELRATPNLIVGLPLVFPAAGPQPYYGAHQINSDADIPPAAIMNLAFANARELDQPGLLQRFEDGQIGYAPGTQFTETWINSAFRNKLRSFRYKCLQQTAQLQIFLNAIRRRIYDRLTTLLSDHNALKVKLVVSVDYQVPHKPDEPHRTLQLNTKFKTVYPVSRLESVILYFQMETLLRNAL